MKRGLVLILILALALLTSCELFVPSPTERTPIGGDIKPTENADSTEDEYIFTVFPEGDYLADSKFDTDEFLPDYDADPSFIQFLTTGHDQALCQTEDTVYSCVGGFIMYMDKATGITGPLCGKPECLHNDSSCNASVSSSVHGFRIYEDKLYWVDSRSSVMQMNLDGTGRERVTSVGGVYENISNDATVVIHRGYVYVAGSKHENIVEGKRMGSVTVNAHPLDGGDGFTVLDKMVDGYGAECVIKPVGNDLYIMLYSFDYEDKENYEGIFEQIEFYRWDSQTRQAELIFNIQTSPEGLRFEKRSIHPVPGDGIYLQGYYRLRTGDDSYAKDCVCKYSFETGTFEEILWLDDEGDQLFFWPIYTKGYIVAETNFNNEFRIYVYDYDLNLLCRTEPIEGHYKHFMGADNEFIYYYCWAEHGKHCFAVPLDGGDVIVID